MCGALNEAVSLAYKKRAGTGIGIIPYNVTMDPHTILNKLRLTYGRLTPEENDALESTWNRGWAPSDPIENLFLCLEEGYITALAFGVPYTIPQMTQKVFDAIRLTCLYQTADLNERVSMRNTKRGVNSRSTSPKRTRQQAATRQIGITEEVT